VAYLFASWNNDYMNGIEELYWNYLNYYGKYSSLDSVMKDKRQFADRWPTGITKLGKQHVGAV